MATNLPELGFSDLNDVIQATKVPSLQILDRSKKVNLHRRFDKHFSSMVTDPVDTTIVENSSGQKPRVIDDNRVLAEANRAAGCELFLKLPKDADPSIEAGDNRIRYHIRVRP